MLFRRRWIWCYGLKAKTTCHYWLEEMLWCHVWLCHHYTTHGDYPKRCRPSSLLFLQLCNRSINTERYASLVSIEFMFLWCWGTIFLRALPAGRANSAVLMKKQISILWHFILQQRSKQTLFWLTYIGCGLVLPSLKLVNLKWKGKHIKHDLQQRLNLHRNMPSSLPRALTPLLSGCS